MIHAVSVGGPYAVSPVNHSSLELMYVEEGRQSLACFSCNMFKWDGGTGDKFEENMVKNFFFYPLIKKSELNEYTSQKYLYMGQPFSLYNVACNKKKLSILLFDFDLHT